MWIRGELTMQRQERVDERQVAVQEEKDLRNIHEVYDFFIESCFFLFFLSRGDWNGL